MKYSCIKPKVVCGLLFALALCLGGPSVWGGSYTFEPYPANLQNLPHARYYTWGIKWDGPDLGLPGGEVIDDAVLRFDNINDWTYEWNDVLHIWMVDELPQVPWRRKNWPGVSIGRDGYYGYSDAFANCGGTFLMNYTDNNWWSEDLVVKLPAEKLQEYISNDGMFGIALDPDCGYNILKVSLSLTTSSIPIPEPLTGLGVCMGVGALVGYLRRRKLF